MSNPSNSRRQIWLPEKAISANYLGLACSLSICAPYHRAALVGRSRLS